MQHNTEPQRGPKILHIPEVLSLIELFGVTMYMQHSRYGEANSFVNIQEILFVLFNLKVCIHTRNGPALVLVLSQMNEVTSSHPVSVKSILILFLHQHLDLQSVCFREVFHTNTLCSLLF